MTPGKLQCFGYFYKQRNQSGLDDKPREWQQGAFTCQNCEETFMYVTSLHQHQIDGHCRSNTQQFTEIDETAADNRSFTCNECGKKFSLVENLTRHKMIHNDSRPFKCNHCGKSFRLSQHLKEHVRIHTGEKPYKCNVCGHAFCQISNLKSHQRTHSKVKAFKCDECGKEFRRSFTLKQHKVAHLRHQILPLEEPLRPSFANHDTKVNSIAPPNGCELKRLSVAPPNRCELKRLSVAPPNGCKSRSVDIVRESAAPVNFSICDLSTRMSETKSSSTWEKFMPTYRPPAVEGIDSEQQALWPEMQEIAKLAKSPTDHIVTPQNFNSSVCDITNNNNRPTKSKRETSFFVEQIIGRRDSTGSDQSVEATSSDDATGGNDVTEPRTGFSWKRHLCQEWGSPQSHKQPRSWHNDVIEWGPWGHVIPMVEWKPVITGWRSLLDGRVYSPHRSSAI